MQIIPGFQKISEYLNYLTVSLKTNSVLLKIFENTQLHNNTVYFEERNKNFKIITSTYKQETQIKYTYLCHLSIIEALFQVNSDDFQKLSKEISEIVTRLPKHLKYQGWLGEY